RPVLHLRRDPPSRLLSPEPPDQIQSEVESGGDTGGRDDAALVDHALRGDDLAAQRPEQIERPVVRRGAQPGEMSRPAEEERARAHARDRPPIPPPAQVLDRARVIEERPGPEPAWDDEKIQRREVA